MASIKGSHFKKYGGHPVKEERGLVVLTTDKFSPELLAEMYPGTFVEVDTATADRKIIGPTCAYYMMRRFSWLRAAFVYTFTSVAWNGAESNYIVQAGTCVRRSFELTVRFYEDYAAARRAALELSKGNL